MSLHYKKIVIEDAETKELKFLMLNNDFIVLDEIDETYIPLDEMEQVLRAPIYTRFFRLFLLHDDESLKEDITDQVVLSGNLEKTYQQGQIRSLNLVLMNPEKIWNPSPYAGKLFANTKFRLQLGVLLDNTMYWRNEGVFVCQDPQLSNGDANKTVSLQLHDKFALLDGTISGTTETDYEMPVGTNIYQGIRSIIRQMKDNLGHPYDSQEIIFPEKYMKEKTAYTIKKTADNNLGEILIELANMLSCDIFYDEIGRLTFRDNLEDLDYHNRNTVWNYSSSENETINISREDKWSEMKNRFIVKGANINGMLCKGIAENTNPSSAYNVYGNFGIKPKIIEDNLIYSPVLCQQRAKYELKKNAIKNTSISFESIYIPHMNPNDLVRWTFNDYNYHNEEFIVQTVSIPLNPSEPMNVSITNVNELPM